MRRAARLSCLVAILPLHPANSANQHTDVAVEMVVPVFQGNVKRPYVVIGHIKDNLRKPFAFMADPTKEKIHAEIWERGRMMGPTRLSMRGMAKPNERCSIMAVPRYPERRSNIPMKVSRAIDPAQAERADAKAKNLSVLAALA